MSVVHECIVNKETSPKFVQSLFSPTSLSLIGNTPMVPVTGSTPGPAVLPETRIAESRRVHQRPDGGCDDRGRGTFRRPQAGTEAG